MEVSHTLLQLHESNIRSLPAKVLLPLALAQQSLDAYTVPAPNNITGVYVTGAPAGANLAVMKQEAQWCLARCSLLQKKLDAAQQKYRQRGSHNTFVGLAAAPENQNVKKQRWILEQR